MRPAKEYLRPLKVPAYAAERSFRSRYPGNLRFPDFLGIGSGQAGSTWLFRNLQQHPRVVMPDIKETHYFDYSFNHCRVSYYCSLFAHGRGRSAVTGEITPSYNLLRPDRIRLVHRFMPDVRLFLMVRHPVYRAWSGARRTLSKVAAEKGCRLEELDDREFYEYFSKEWAYRPERHPKGAYPKGMLQGHYCRTIEHWTRYFPEEQLLIGFFDEIESDPRGLLERIFLHIGVDTDIDWSTMPLKDVVNRNPSYPLPERFRIWLEELYADELRELRQRFAGASVDWLRQG